jgi:ribosomal protein S27AE
MLVALSLAPLLLTLELARRALEPECPSCSEKDWAAHSTQLLCSRCGWGGKKNEE